MRRAFLPRLTALAGLLAGAVIFHPSPSFAQAPPAVPALPDSERRVSYSISSQTGPFSVSFALYGDSTDYGDWLQVWLCTSSTLTPCSQLTAVTDYTLSSATGALATIPRPITDATITLTTARTGTLQIVGARRPRRTAQFAENRGVAARDLNQIVTDLVAQNRENWDLQQRQLKGPPGETISAMQPASTRAGGILCWDSTGLIPRTCAPGSSGTANVVGPNVSVVGHIATFGNTAGTVLADGGLIGSGNMIGPSPSVSVADHVVTWKDTGGINTKDSGLTLTASTGTFTLTNAKTLAVTNTLTLSGTDGTTMTFPTTSATVARTDAANTFTGHQTIEGVTSTGATGTGNLVFATAPTLGAITVTSVDKVAITAPATGSTLTIADGKTLTANSSLTLAGTDAKTLTVSNSGTLAGGDAFTLAIAAGKTLTANSSLTLAGADSKTLTVNNSGTIGGGDAFTLAIAAAKTLTVSNSLTLTGTDGTSFAFPSTSDTVTTLAASQILTNKTLTAPVINGGTATALTALGIRSTGTGAFDLTLANTENLTAGRTLTLTVNNAPRTLSMSGNLTLSADLITSGGSPLTLTGTGSTNVTLPTSGTLATRDTAQTFSSSNIFSAVTQFTDIKLSSGKIYPTADSTTALQVTKADGTTRIVNFDTTNARVGINKTAGAYDLDVNGATNVGGRLTFGVLDGASLAASPSTITDMTVNNSPSASNDYFMYYSASAGALRRCTVGSCAAAATAGVSSLNGLTGGLSLVHSGGATVSNSGLVVTVGDPGGYINRFRNASMNIWSRGTSAITVTTSGAYTADGWIVTPTGASVTVARNTGNGAAPYSLSITGAASVTATTVAQRIESSVAAVMAGATVTVQFQYNQDSGGAVTPKVSTCYASVVDNFGTCTADLAATSISSCNTGAWCTEAYTFTASANAVNGYQVTFDCNYAMNSGAKHCAITSVDIRVTPSASVGITSFPPPVEYRTIATEMILAQRYMWRFSADGAGSNTFLGVNGVCYGSGSIYVPILLPIAMRAPPAYTISASSDFKFIGAGATPDVSGATLDSVSAKGVIINTTNACTSGYAYMMVPKTNAAYMQFSSEL